MAFPLFNPLSHSLVTVKPRWDGKRGEIQGQWKRENEGVEVERNGSVAVRDQTRGALKFVASLLRSDGIGTSRGRRS